MNRKGKGICIECGGMWGQHFNGCPETPEPAWLPPGRQPDDCDDAPPRENPEPDYDAIKPKTPLESWLTEDEHHQP